MDPQVNLPAADLTDLDPPCQPADPTSPSPFTESPWPPLPRVMRETDAARECEDDARKCEEWWQDQAALEAAIEYEQRVDMRRTFGLSDDTLTTDQF